jgi:hypothetical protein
MRLGLLTDGKISVWQRQALERLSADHDIYLIVPKGERRPKREARHALYYALNLVTIRNRLTRMVDLPDLRPVETVEFKPSFDAAWAVLPDELLEWINARKLDAIVKFGLGLLRVPPPERLSAPILSYHHGDPRKYRGRPAGFYELLDGEPFMGQIVQAIGAKLDGGTVYAFSETRVLPHSYRQTLVDSFALSPYLLSEALENVRLARPLPIVPDGRNYRLPGNWTVARFVGGRLLAALRRAGYGMFVDKRWKVATAPTGETQDPLGAVRQVGGEEWNVARIADRYSFYADPFFGSGPKEIFVEAMNRRSGKGEVVRIVDGRSTPIRGLSGHVSYPASIEEAGSRLLIPETTGWCPLTAFAIEDGEARPVAEIDIDESRLVDPTFLRHNGRIYLFANVLEDGTSVLHLWHADSLRSKFTRHPQSPIRVSARGSRMAGEIAEWKGELYRIGQLWRRSYGDGVIVFRITALSETDYAEECVGEAAFEHLRGPHTVNRRDGLLLFDYYSERLSPLAGVRRLLNRL